MTVLIIIAAVAAAIMVIAVIGARWGRPRPMPVGPSWSWEGIRLAPAAVEPASSDEQDRGPSRTDRSKRPRLVIRGEYMARPSIYREAVSDWAFASEPTPIVVLFDVGREVELHRASLDRIRGEYRALVQDLSISYAMPPPPLPVSDDGGRREGGPFAVDIGFYLEPRDEAWELRVHAELGPLRSDPITIRVPARESS